MCSFLGHETYEFKDYKFNPNSKNYCGKCFKDAWKEIKAKKELNANEQDETTEGNNDATSEHYAMSKSDANESNTHPKTTTTMPDKPGSKKRKTHRTLFDARASASLIALELLDEDLKGCIKNPNKKSKWKTGVDEFLSEGTVTISKTAFPTFVTQRETEIEFDLLPR